LKIASYTWIYDFILIKITDFETNESWNKVWILFGGKKTPL
jgi:hypothetical protein